MDRIINYQTSLFGSFIDLKPETDIIIKLLASLKDEHFIPATVDLASIDIVSGKLSMESRMQFVSTDKSWSIAFLKDRIDFNYNYQEGADPIKNIDHLGEYAKKIITYVFSVFAATKGNRIAVNCKILLDKMTDEEIGSFTQRFTNPFKGFENNDLLEWGMRYNYSRDIDVDCSRTEKSNCIVDMSKVVSVNNPNDSRIMVSLDINTIQEIIQMRFDYTNMLYFSENARVLMKEILQEIIR